MKEGCCSQLGADTGVLLVNQLLSKTACTFSTPAAREDSELSHGEVAGENRNDVEKPSFGLGVAQASDSLYVNSGNIHRFKISLWILGSPEAA